MKRSSISKVDSDFRNHYLDPTCWGCYPFTNRHLDMEMYLSDSDCGSSSDSSCSDYLDDINSIYGGQAQSILSNMERSIGKIDDFLAFERGFVHGDIVCYGINPSGQLGKVVDLDIVVDLETIHGKILKEVNCKKLQKVCPFVVGDYVVHGPWLGRVSRVVDRLTILFDDGAKCEVTAVNPEDIRPIFPSVVEDSQYPYYPGQRVHIRISSVSESARWMWGRFKENRAEGTVYHVEAGIVYVDWVASAVIMKSLAPPSLQDSKDLTLMSCFTHANWHLGDWCILPIAEQNIVKEQVLNAYGIGHISEQNKIEKELTQVDQKYSHEEIHIIVNKKMRVDVLWQDGTHSIGLDTQSLLPVNSVSDHEFWPEQYVLEKRSCDDPDFVSAQRSGIVKSMDSKERTVRMKWKTNTGYQTNDSDGKCEETVSAYELVEHPDYSYCHGDIVFKLGNSLSVIQVAGHSECEGTPITETISGSVEQLKEDYNTNPSESSWKSQKDCFLSCIGNVIGFKDEGIVVRWASGITAKVGPWEIVGIDKYEDPVAAPVVHEEDTEDSSSQMPEHDKIFAHMKDKDVFKYAGNSIGGDNNKEIWEMGVSFIRQAALGFFKNIAVSLFGSSGSTLLSSSIECSPSNLVSNQHPSAIANEIYENEETKCFYATSVPLSNVDYPEKNMKPEVEESQNKIVAHYSSTSEKPRNFKQFDTVTDLSDHYFVCGGGKGSISPQVKRGWLKKIQQDWSILERGLPGTIYVRACEERLDLLRAAIVGAPGTPYHDGLYFFDFFLPPDYPCEPPMVHYHSGGLRLNPNLYESGKICLSLLNTWTGTGSEAWDPGNSTILQVLLSLQALVLNEKPYFNEAGYDTHIGSAEGEKNSITYNENAFLLSCKSMLYIASKPPKHFEELVEEHFCCRSHSIIQACEAYMEGAPVGHAFDSGTCSHDAQKSSSTGFKIMLTKLFPKLVSGFTDRGLKCSQSLVHEGNGEDDE